MCILFMFTTCDDKPSRCVGHPANTRYFHQSSRPLGRLHVSVSRTLLVVTSTPRRRALVKMTRRERIRPGWRNGRALDSGPRGHGLEPRPVRSVAASRLEAASPSVRVIKINHYKEYLVFAMSKKTATQGVVGSSVQAFRRFKNPRSTKQRAS